MKPQTYFYIKVLAGSLFCLYVPLWFAPFLIALVVGYLSEESLKRTMLIHLGVYTLVCACYCLYVYSTGSKELVGMIGEIFQGISFTLLMIISSLFFGVTALMGAWVGGELNPPDRLTRKNLILVEKAGQSGENEDCK